MSLPTPYQTPEHQPFLWRGDGPGAALLIHGFPGTPAEMRLPAQALQADGWTVQGLLLPGFGPQFAEITRYCQADWAHAVIGAAQELRPVFNPLLLVGNSVGAVLALQTATHVLVDGLMLFAPFWRADNRLLDLVYPVARHVVRQLHPFAKADFQDVTFRDNLARFLPGADLDDAVMQAAIRKLALPTSVLGEVRRAGQLGYQATGRIQAPVLIIQGSADPVARPKLTRHLARRLPNLAGYVEMRDGHELIQTDDEGWAARSVLLRRFAAQVCAGAPSMRRLPER